MPKNYIVHFPWGGAGNLVRNIMTISPDVEMLDDRGQQVGPGTGNREYPNKEKFMTDFFVGHNENGPWLKTEWSIREHLYFKYYHNHGIAYWNPAIGIAYDTHGMTDELASIRKREPLRYWNRYLVNNEGAEDVVCPKLAIDFEHIFLLPSNRDFIAEHYWSKNPNLSPQFDDLIDMDQKVTASRAAIDRQCNRLEEFYNELLAEGRTNYHRIDAVDLFKDTGWVYLMEVVDKYNLCVNIAVVRRIHETWLSTTRAIYEKHFKKAYPL